MSMSLKESALLEDARVRAALRFTDAIGLDTAPDVEPPSRAEETTAFRTGWVLVVSESRVRAYPAWTTSHDHGEGDPDQRLQGRGRRGPTPLYSTKDRALRDGRQRLERQFAESLRQLDREIAEAIGRS